MAEEYKLVADCDLDGEMFYYIDQNEIQTSPCFDSKEAACHWFETNIRNTPYQGKERRTNSEDGPKRRFSDIKLDAR